VSSAQSETIAVIGAGRTGRALARRAALGGFEVVLEDLVPISLEQARLEIRRELDEMVAAGALESWQANLAYERIRYAATIEAAARQAHVVMETGPDEYESKLEMFCLLDRICLPGTVIISNCRQLELSDTATNAHAIVGMYFEGDEAELHCSAFTSEQALEVARRLAGRMAKKFRITREGQASAQA
jgi:3-hydroxybutyryl-CoA dehydrogenase